MKLDDQVLFIKENGVHKIVVLSGHMTEYDDLLIGHDLDGNEYLIDWDLAGRYTEGSHGGRFIYWHGEHNPLKEVIFEREVLAKLNLKADDEIDASKLKEIEKELNKKEHTLTI